MSADATSGGGPGSRGADGHDHDRDRDDFRRMAPTYAAVVIVETLVLIALWWFQRHFS